MRRPGLLIVALGVAGAIVFAPTPGTTRAAEGSKRDSGALIGPILSPTGATADIRERDQRKPTRDQSEGLWLLGTLAAFFGACIRRIIATLGHAGPPPVSAATADWFGGRAPPVLA